MRSKTILQYECCETMHISYFLLIVYKNYLNWGKDRLYKDIDQKLMIDYVIPGSWSMSLFLTVAIGDSKSNLTDQRDVPL